MNKYFSLTLVILFLALSITTATLWQQVRALENELTSISHETEAPALHLLMGTMQQYLHKLTYAVDNEQAELANFYLHELEEISNDIVQNIPEYDGFPVGDLTENMLLPVLEETEAVIAKENWERIEKSASLIVQTCNNCHSSTEHGFIRITGQASQNPFNQNFSSP